MDFQILSGRKPPTEIEFSSVYRHWTKIIEGKRDKSIYVQVKEKLLLRLPFDTTVKFSYIQRKFKYPKHVVQFSNTAMLVKLFCHCHISLN